MADVGVSEAMEAPDPGPAPISGVGASSVGATGGGGAGAGLAGQVPSLKDMLGWVMKGEVALATGIGLIIVLLIVPVPSFLLDFLLSISITASILVLMTALLLKRPLDFNAFPTVLLVTTLYRLALNMASTRLILAEGHEGEAAAGATIKAFGQLITQGNFVIGVIIFIIMVVVNFVVITKGSTRIAEVSARFTLDSMPGKQMAIDADLSAGLITPDEAKKRRKDVEKESNFFGAMDGASKFVRGDAVAGIIITAIQAIGGIIIGTLQHGLDIGTAANHYILLTVGDGLVTQIPALITSMAAGFLVSKSGVEGSADKALVNQLARNPVSLGMVSAAAGIMGLVPGMPILPFSLLAIGTGYLAWRLHKNPPMTPEEQEAAEKAIHEAEEAKALAESGPAEEPITTALMMDDLKIELGYGLLGLINDLEGRRLTDQIVALRRSMASEFGFVMPSVRILDNMRLPNQGYALRVKEMEAGQGEVRLGHLMAMDPMGRQVDLPGEHTREPAFGLPATWIVEDLREEATFRGYTIVDPSTVISTHLTEIVKEAMPDLLSYAETQKLLGDLPEDQKKLVSDVIPSVVPIATVQRVLQALLKEKVSIRDLPGILEALAEAAPHTNSITQLIEHVRSRLARQLCHAHRGDDGNLAIIPLSPDWEQAFAESLVGQGEDRQLAMPPSQLQEFISLTRDAFDRAGMNGELPVLLTSPVIRPYVRSIVERFRAQTPVMSQNEIHPKARLKTVGQI